MNNKLKPVTLIVGASSEISFELIQKFEKTKTLLIVSRNEPQLINENIFISHNIEKEPLTADIINKKLENSEVLGVMEPFIFTNSPLKLSVGILKLSNSLNQISRKSN